MRRTNQVAAQCVLLVVANTHGVGAGDKSKLLDDALDLLKAVLLADGAREVELGSKAKVLPHRQRRPQPVVKKKGTGSWEAKAGKAQGVARSCTLVIPVAHVGVGSVIAMDKSLPPR